MKCTAHAKMMSCHAMSDREIQSLQSSWRKAAEEYLLLSAQEADDRGSCLL